MRGAWFTHSSHVALAGAPHIARTRPDTRPSATSRLHPGALRWTSATLRALAPRDAVGECRTKTVLGVVRVEREKKGWVVKERIAVVGRGGSTQRGRASQHTTEVCERFDRADIVAYRARVVQQTWSQSKERMCGPVRCGAARCGAVRCSAARCGAVWGLTSHYHNEVHAVELFQQQIHNADQQVWRVRLQRRRFFPCHRGIGALPRSSTVQRGGRRTNRRICK